MAELRRALAWQPKDDLKEFTRWPCRVLKCTEARRSRDWTSFRSSFTDKMECSRCQLTGLHAMLKEDSPMTELVSFVLLAVDRLKHSQGWLMAKDLSSASNSSLVRFLAETSMLDHCSFFAFMSSEFYLKPNLFSPHNLFIFSLRMESFFRFYFRQKKLLRRIKIFSLTWCSCYNWSQMSFEDVYFYTTLLCFITDDEHRSSLFWRGFYLSKVEDPRQESR